LADVAGPVVAESVAAVAPDVAKAAVNRIVEKSFKIVS
jgi:hypothetical protein